MKYYRTKKNPQFTGREFYLQRLREIDAEKEAAVIVVYGRRRVGKTELIEQFFKDRPILKFEGIQPENETIRRGDPAERRRQIRECLMRLGRYVERTEEYLHLSIDRWSDFFALLMPVISRRSVVLYFEELQWLANYGNGLLAEFKPYWDDTLRHNPGLRVVISGSSPSFITNQFLYSSAMYNRSNHMMKLEPFSLREIRSFMKKGDQETLQAAIAVGGIPEYLKQLKKAPSVYLGLCEKSFVPNAFFRKEQHKVFVSSLASNRFYRGIIEYLARHKYATRKDMYTALSREHSTAPGGSFTEVLDELIELNFVERYVPLTIKKPETSRLARFAISDEYLQFYYRFIEPRKKDIDGGRYAKNPTQALSHKDFNQLLGFSFERWCRKNVHLIARCMDFGSVDYKHGAWYEKASARSSSDGDAQIDLMYIRKDAKIIVCEIKYNDGSDIDRDVIYETQRKVSRFIKENPKYGRYTVEMALITTRPAPEAIRNEGFFAYLIDGKKLFETAQRD